jgi:peptidoglycan/xylan/chitin deacetylase (PgdA/CDA1 family)
MKEEESLKEENLEKEEILNEKEKLQIKSLESKEQISTEKKTETISPPIIPIEQISQNNTKKTGLIKKILKTFLIIILFLIISLFLTRLLNSREIDDVNPNIPCDTEYMQKSDTLWVIPNFKNSQISENSTWCSYILNKNKAIGMHGITHEYWEFKTDKTEEYLKNGTEIFKNCFGFEPIMFKPPQLKISDNNKELIKKSGMNLKFNWNQLIHKVYHCNDSEEILSNRIIDWI